ncbi:44485_t:CDS:2 [Gigaspora margarita]|uniref:44485_t:CDS:1 n=1 Tax=Gigaspora margarita TaxID=4874 RepID=A0ABM8W199_GIGMA|nr:44485_t:CDS:2 [Gigaspora margarita]
MRNHKPIQKQDFADTKHDYVRNNSRFIQENLKIIICISHGLALLSLAQTLNFFSSYQ